MIKGMVVKLLNYGATLEKVLLPEADGLHNMILSLPSREDYSKSATSLVARWVELLAGFVVMFGSMAM